MSDKADAEAGKPTLWDSAWREGHAHGLMNALGIPYKDACTRTMLMLSGEPLDKTSVTTQNSRGEWVPAIPLPLYGLRKRCECGRKFWTTAGYQGHYALCHVLHLGAALDEASDERAPRGLGMRRIGPPFWWKPWLAPWHALRDSWYRPRPVRERRP